MTDLYPSSAWFRHSRFGMFIHWGAYALPARGEWVRSAERMSVEQYQPYVDDFVPSAFTPEAWAQTAADAGMKYAVLTAKHHDGFCLFDSKLTEYTTMHNGFGRDVVAEFLAAFRAKGIKVGLYYSLLDWHHPDYPSFGDMFHPMRDELTWAAHEPNLPRYLEYMHAQIEELCTNYGELDLLWFDFSYDKMRSDAWGARSLIDMVRRLQPNVLIDNRLETSGEGFGTLVTENPTPWSGDFVSPEQLIPDEGILNSAGRPVPWEACVTLNNNWGYNATDTIWKSPQTLVRKLVECTSKGGNLLLNVGPDAEGRIPRESLDVLEAIGSWMRSNGDSIYGATFASIPKPSWGYYTRAADRLFAHVLEQPIGPLALSGVNAERIGSIRVLADGSELARTDSWITEAYPDTAFVSFGDVPHFTYPLPDATDTVLELTLIEPVNFGVDGRMISA